VGRNFAAILTLRSPASRREATREWHRDSIGQTPPLLTDEQSRWVPFGQVERFRRARKVADQREMLESGWAPQAAMPIMLLQARPVNMVGEWLNVAEWGVAEIWLRVAENSPTRDESFPVCPPGLLSD